MKRHPSTRTVERKDEKQQTSLWMNYIAFPYEKYIKKYRKLGNMIISSNTSQVTEQNHKTEFSYRVPKEHIRRTPFVLNAMNIDTTCAHYLEIPTDFETRKMRYCTNPMVIKKVGRSSMIAGCYKNRFECRGECAIIIEGGEDKW